MFSAEEILTEFVEAAERAVANRDLVSTFAMARAFTRARVLRAQQTWIQNPINREKKRRNMIAYRLRKKGENPCR